MFDILIIVVLQFGKDGAMQMEKRGESAFLSYFTVLIILVGSSMITSMNIVNLVYLVVVLCCVLKFKLIVNKNRK